ncbi:cytochrome P450 9e2-like [Amphibalanus amphitrite]|uniref:cytochrome P450 9e2-like n=1 Tax=Amphibalanus amphitrite TaxID=1232801 RepID=UPI001C91F484|nr:cytochrome P450 9e2-like [Amphibalanus amphitrite]
MLGWLLTAPLAVLSWLCSPVPLTVIVLLCAWIYRTATKNFDFWKSRGVPGPAPCFPWGNETGPPLSKPLYEVETWLYREHGGKKYCGFFEMHRPVLFVGDPDLIRSITIKDFEYFTDHSDQGIAEDLKGALIALKGAKWKESRAVLTPAFSSSKLKGMHQLVLDNTQNLTKYVMEDMNKKGEVDIRDMFARYTMDNIASCAFGVKSNSFDDSKSRFATEASNLFQISFLGVVRFMAETVFPKPLLKWLPGPQQKAIDFFTDVVNKTIDYRDKHPTSSRDFLQLMMDTKDKDGNRILTSKSIMAQAVLFFIGGFDTTASLLTFAAYSLATHPEIQERVQEETDEVLSKHGALTYDAVHEMPYLDQVLAETLRLYPPFSRTERVATKDYTLPGTDIRLPTGTAVQMSPFAIQRDPDHYPDPLRFDPDRFLPEEKERRHPCVYLPFGSGPRVCIATRFALFEAKVALVALLKQATLKPTSTTPPPPAPLDKKSFILSPEGQKLPLLVVPRSKTG